MNRLKLRQLEVFVDIFHRKKIATAGAALGLTQSAASIALRELERSIGTALFDRTTRSMLPTKAAVDLLPIAERMLRDARLAERMFQAGTASSARLGIAATPTIAQTLLPGLLRAFLQQCPHVEVDILDVPPSRFVMTMVSGQADIGLGYVGADEMDLRQHRLLSDQLCLVSRKVDGTTHAPTPTWKSIQHFPLVLIQPGYGIRALIDDTARKAGIALKISHEVSLLTTALSMTRIGLAHTIAPAQIAGLDMFPDLHARPIEEPSVRRDLSAVFALDRTPTPISQEFVRHCRETLKRDSYYVPSD